MKLRLTILICTIFTLHSCSQSDITIDDFSFVLGKWKSDLGKKRYATCECSMGKEEIICDVNTYKRVDSTKFSRIKYYIKQNANSWQVTEEVFGTRNLYKAFDLDKSKSRTFDIIDTKPLSFHALRAPENDGRQYLVMELLKNNKLVITDYFYTYNFEKVE